MEYAIDYVWRLYTRVPLVRQWMQANVESWSFLADWLGKYKEPPVQYMTGMGMQGQQIRMNKTRGQDGHLNGERFNNKQNQVNYFYR